MRTNSVVSQHSGWRRLLLLGMLSAVALTAQSDQWAHVEALALGTPVEVKRFSGAGKVRGAVESVSGDILIVRRSQDIVTLNRTEIRRIRLRSTEKTKVGRLTGTVILGGLGVVGAAISDEGSAGERAAVVGIWGGLGYLIGWAFDRPKHIVIYTAERP